MLNPAAAGLESEGKYKFLFWPLSFLLMPSFHSSRHEGQGRVCCLQPTRVSFGCQSYQCGAVFDQSILRGSMQLLTILQ